MQIFIFVFCINLHISLKATVRALSCRGSITRGSSQLMECEAAERSFAPSNSPILWLFRPKIPARERVDTDHVVTL